MRTKRCPRCGRTQAAAAFYPHRSRPDGLSSWCRACQQVRRRAGGVRSTEADHHTERTLQIRAALATEAEVDAFDLAEQRRELAALAAELPDIERRLAAARLLKLLGRGEEVPAIELELLCPDMTEAGAIAC